jgi:hypothetical protein
MKEQERRIAKIRAGDALIPFTILTPAQEAGARHSVDAKPRQIHPTEISARVFLATPNYLSERMARWREALRVPRQAGLRKM